MVLITNFDEYKGAVGDTYQWLKPSIKLGIIDPVILNFTLSYLSTSSKSTYRKPPG
jgi:hypothetical protein